MLRDRSPILCSFSLLLLLSLRAAAASWKPSRDWVIIGGDDFCHKRSLRREIPRARLALTLVGHVSNVADTPRVFQARRVVERRLAARAGPVWRTGEQESGRKKTGKKDDLGLSGRFLGPHFSAILRSRLRSHACRADGNAPIDPLDVAKLPRTGNN